MGLGAQLVVRCSVVGFPPCVEVSVKVKLGILRDSHWFLEHFRAGGGGLVWRSRGIHLWVPLYIMGLLYLSHSTWAVWLLG